MARFSRRGLLRSGAAAGVLAATGLPLAAHARRGGRLRLGLSGAHPSDNWDARTHADCFMICAAVGAVFDTLTEIAADGSLKGELAESWDASPDARVWTFNLRRGVTFHNGKAFAAEDVIASLALHRDPSRLSPAAPLLAGVLEMRQVTPHQVQFVLDAGNADFPYLLSDYHLLIYPAGQIVEAMATGIGTGLYKVKRFEPGARFVGVRVQSHYKDGEAGWFEEVDLIAMPDPEARKAALVSGRVDAIGDVAPAQIPALRANPRVAVVETVGNQHLSFPMTMDVAPFDRLDVRLGLKYAVDRVRMVSDVLGGHGQVGNDSPIGPANPYYHAGMAQIPHDPDRARFHVRRAGVTDLRIPLSVSDAAFPGAATAAALYKAAAEDVGLRIDIVPVPRNDYWRTVWRVAPWAASSWAGRATEDWMLSTTLTGAAPWNDTHWADPRFEALLRRGRSEMDSDRRRAIYHEAQEILRDAGGAVIPAFANFLAAKSRKLAHSGTVGTALKLDNGRIAERWWMA